MERRDPVHPNTSKVSAHPIALPCHTHPTITISRSWNFLGTLSEDTSTSITISPPEDGATTLALGYTYIESHLFSTYKIARGNPENFQPNFRKSKKNSFRSEGKVVKGDGYNPGSKSGPSHQAARQHRVSHFLISPDKLSTINSPLAEIRLYSSSEMLLFPKLARRE
jgi:hypothetical protein